MAGIALRLSGRPDSLDQFFENPLFQSKVQQDWQSFRKKRELPTNAAAVFRFRVGNQEAEDVNAQVESALDFLQSSFMQMEELLRSVNRVTCTLELVWEVPGDGFSRSTTLPSDLALLCGRLGIAINLSTHAVEGKAFEG